MSRTGTRFVNSTGSASSLPGTLFAKSGKAYTRVRIGSRTPSIRLRPEGDTISFWKEDPSGLPKTEKLPEPYLTVKVPSSGRNVCILTLDAKSTADKALARTTILKENEFPKSGMHVINMSPYPVSITAARKNDFSDKKDFRLAALAAGETYSTRNVWSFAGENGEKINCVLEYARPTDNGTKLQRIRATAAVVSNRQSQVSLILRKPGSKTHEVTLETIQLAD